MMEEQTISSSRLSCPASDPNDHNSTDQSKHSANSSTPDSHSNKNSLHHVKQSTAAHVEKGNKQSLSSGDASSSHNQQIQPASSSNASTTGSIISSSTSGVTTGGTSGHMDSHSGQSSFTLTPLSSVSIPSQMQQQQQPIQVMQGFQGFTPLYQNPGQQMFQNPTSLIIQGIPTGFGQNVQLQIPQTPPGVSISPVANKLPIGHLPKSVGAGGNAHGTHSLQAIRPAINQNPGIRFSQSFGTGTQQNQPTVLLPLNTTLLQSHQTQMTLANKTSEQKNKSYIMSPASIQPKPSIMPSVSTGSVMSQFRPGLGTQLITQSPNIFGQTNFLQPFQPQGLTWNGLGSPNPQTLYFRPDQMQSFQYIQSPMGIGGNMQIVQNHSGRTLTPSHHSVPFSIASSSGPSLTTMTMSHHTSQPQVTHAVPQPVAVTSSPAKLKPLAARPPSSSMGTQTAPSPLKSAAPETPKTNINNNNNNNNPVAQNKAKPAAAHPPVKTTPTLKTSSSTQVSASDSSTPMSQKLPASSETTPRTSTTPVINKQPPVPRSSDNNAAAPRVVVMKTDQGVGTSCHVVPVKNSPVVKNDGNQTMANNNMKSNISSNDTRVPVGNNKVSTATGSDVPVLSVIPIRSLEKMTSDKKSVEKKDASTSHNALGPYSMNSVIRKEKSNQKMMPETLKAETVPKPKAVVKHEPESSGPEVLVHVIEEYIIEESAHPFPVNGAPEPLKNGSVKNERPTPSPTVSEASTESFGRTRSSSDASKSQKPPPKPKAVKTNGNKKQNATPVQNQSGVKRNVTGSQLGLFNPVTSRISNMSEYDFNSGPDNISVSSGENDRVSVGSDTEKPKRQRVSKKSTPVNPVVSTPISKPAAVATPHEKSVPVSNGMNGTPSTSSSCNIMPEAPVINAAIAGLYIPPSGTDPREWNVQDVYDFIRHLSGCEEYADEFKSQEVDGQALMLLKESHLLETMGMKLGPAIKLSNKIKALNESLSQS